MAASFCRWPHPPAKPPFVTFCNSMQLVPTETFGLKQLGIGLEVVEQQGVALSLRIELTKGLSNSPGPKALKSCPLHFTLAFCQQELMVIINWSRDYGTIL